MIHPYRNKISWTGVFSGLIVGLVVFLASLNVGALVTSLLPLDLTGTGIAAVIWGFISVVAAAYVAGAVAMYVQNPEAKFHEVENTPEEIEYTTHRFRFDAKINGLVTGALVLILTTYFSVVGLASLFVNTAKVATVSVATTTAATAGAATGVASLDEVKNYFSHISANDVEKFIDQNVSGISGEQAFAVKNVVAAEFDQASKNLQATPFYNLPQVIKDEYFTLKNNLSGITFRNNLIASGLTVDEANRTIIALNRYMNELQAQVQQTIDKTVEYVKNMTIALTLTWILKAALILGFSVLGAISMAHTTHTREVEKKHPTQKKVRV